MEDSKTAGVLEVESVVEVNLVDRVTDDDAKISEKTPTRDFIAPVGQTCCGPLKYGHQPWHILPYHPSVYRRDAMQIKDEVIAGITVAFAQVSESIAFAFIAGVGPLLGLHAAWIIGLSLSIFGSRPGMINGATGVRAAVLAPYVKQYGIGYLFWIVLVISFYQFVAGVFKLAKFVRMVPRPVMIGFVNGLATILTLGQVVQFVIQCDQEKVISSRTRPLPATCGKWVNATNTTRVFQGSETLMIDGAELAFMFFHIVMVFATIKLIPRIPKIGKYIPASITGILIATFFEWVAIRPGGYRTPIIGEVGRVSGGMPIPFFIDPQYSGQIVPLNWETLRICALPAFIAAAAGAVEAVMTMEVVNDKTETGNESPNQQLIALSIGNAISAIYGTMGGGATIGLSVINCENGANGRYRISGIVAGIMVFVFVLAAAPLIEIIPTASLVGVMVVVILSTMDWESLWMIALSFIPLSWRESPRWAAWALKYPILSSRRKIRRIDATVIVVVWVVTLWQDLFVAVMAGVLLTAASFAWDVGENISVEVSERMVKSDDGKVEKVKVYQLQGPLFFASAQRFVGLFTPAADPDVVELHFDRDGSDLCDYSAIHAINVVGEKYKKIGKKILLRHLSERAKRMLAKTEKLNVNFEIEEDATEILGGARPLVHRAF